MRCAMTGIPIQDSSDGVWGDGEWISWAWINEQIAEPDEQAEAGEHGVVVEDPEILRLMRQAAAEDEAGSTPPHRGGVRSGSDTPRLLLTSRWFAPVRRVTMAGWDTSSSR